MNVQVEWLSFENSPETVTLRATQKGIRSTQFNIQWRWNYYPFSHNHGSVENYPQMKGIELLLEIHPFFTEPWLLEEGYHLKALTFVNFLNIFVRCFEACCEYCPRKQICMDVWIYVWWTYIWSICMIHVDNWYTSVPLEWNRGRNLTNCRVEGCELPGGHADWYTKTTRKSPGRSRCIISRNFLVSPFAKKTSTEQTTFQRFFVLEARNPWIWVFG